MEKITLTIKDDSKLNFFLKLLKQFDYVEVETTKKQVIKKKHDLFASAGLWKNRDVDGYELRKRAWKRTN